MVTKFPALTGLRFFACAMILLHHMRGSFGLPIFKGWLLDQGVSLFFVLSGFVLFYNYPVLRDWQERRTFLFARLARLGPAYLVSILAALLFIPGLLRIGFIGPVVLSNLLLIQSWIPIETIPSLNGPSWSISTEFGFYLLFLWLVIDFGRTWWWKAVLASAVTVAVIIMANHFGGFFLTLSRVSPWPRAIEFVSGMATCMAWQKFGLYAPRSVFIATIAELSLTLMFALTSVWAGYIWRNTEWMHAAGMTQWFGFAGSCLIPSCLLLFILAKGHGLISKCLSWPPVILLGEASYSIYLFHMTVLFVINLYVVGHAPHLVALALYLSTTIILAILCLIIVEKPSRRFLMSSFSLSPPGIAVSPAP